MGQTLDWFCKGIELTHSHQPEEAIPYRAAARALIGGGGGCIFIYSSCARLVSFEIKFISKEVSRAEPEYMNIHPPISVLATALIPYSHDKCEPGLS